MSPPPATGAATLGEFVQVIRGVSYKKAHSSKEPAPGLVPILRATNVQETLDFEDPVYVPESYVSDEQYLRPYDIVVAASSGSRRVVGKAAQLRIPWHGSFGAFCFALRPRGNADPRFLAWFLQTPFYRNRVAELAAGVNINNLRAKHIEETPIEVPSLEAQRRIVEETEKQLTRLEAGVAALKRVQANIKRYRAAVLTAACEGRLVPTEAELARSEGRSYEPASVVLACIQAAKVEPARVAAPSRHAKQRRDGAATLPPNLPELPEGWAWARVGQLGSILGGLTKNPKRAKLAHQYPYLRVANVYANELRLDHIERIGVEDRELAKLLLEPGDLLIVEGNGSREQIGRVALWDGSIDPCVHQNHLIKARLVLPEMSRWILTWLLSPGGRVLVEAVASSTSGLYTLSVGKVGGLLVPIPPLAEQHRIVAEVDRRLSLADDLHRIISANLHRATRLRHAVLTAAFAGTLVQSSSPTSNKRDSARREVKRV
jgi:type I restriction enzyme S subunit